MSQARVKQCVSELPTTIKIGAYDWVVDTMAGTEEALCGQADFSCLKMRLWPENLSSPSHAVGVTLHECLHVIFENHNLTKAMRSKGDREEAIIIGFEAGLISLFRDNKKLLSWMKKWLR